MSERDLFLAALQRPDRAGRAAFLDGACGGDAALREQVEALLREHEQLGSFLEPPAPALVATLDEPAGERPGAAVGPYKLLEQIGEGGFGVVFMAEQQAPLRRRVALKVLKPGMDTRQVIARFEAERQALALMDHPNIARVLDGGEAVTGRPYFVMELVRGARITDFCDQNHLPVRARLGLFVDVCRAVQHAHHKGVIHRDLKPSNVLVMLQDGAALVKVIDFGVAKALGQQLTDRTLFTGLAQLVGTPLYMSPEQAALSNVDVDTRSDVYALGVLLYELLTGTTPFDRRRFREAGYDELRRIIREEEPPRPSTRLSTLGQAATAVSAQRQSDPKRLGQLLRGELDWVVMKCLEKDRNRRYPTANDLARDVERYLRDEPVQACPPSALYRFRKAARRHKAALATGGLILLFIALLGAGAGWASRGRAARRQVVEQAATRALEEADERQDQGKWHEALAAAERAQAALASGEGSADLQERVAARLAELRLVQRLDELRTERGDLLDSLRANDAYARAFADFGIDVDGLSPAEVAAWARRRPAGAVRIAAALDGWAIVRRDLGLHRKQDPATWERLVEAARLADRDPWRSRLRQLWGREDREALRQLADSSDLTTLPVESLQLMGAALVFAGDGPGGVAWLRKAHRLHPGDGLISFDLAYHLSHLPAASWPEVLHFAEAALAARPQSAPLHNFVGVALSTLGKYDEAIIAYRRAIALKPDFGPAHAHLAIALGRTGRHEVAIAHLQRRHDQLLQQLGPGHPELLCAMNNLAWAHLLAGQRDKAVRLFEETLEKQKAGLAPDDPRTVDTVAHLAGAYSGVGKLDRAVPLFEEALAKRKAGLGPDHPDTLNTLNNLAWAYQAAGQFDRARPLFEEVVDKLPLHQRPTALKARARCYGELGEWGKAAADLTRAIDLGPDDVQGAWYPLAVLHLRAGRVGEYRALCQRLLDRYGRKEDHWVVITCKLAPDAVADLSRPVQIAEGLVASKPQDAEYVGVLGDALYRKGDWGPAVRRLETSLRTGPRAGGAPFRKLFLAMAYHRLGRAAEARQLFQEVTGWMETNAPEERPPGAGPAPLAWPYRLDLQLLRREAEATLGQAPAGDRPGRGKERGPNGP
jgi:serine/threonine protein kinase/tetratricopeptide (TPR) repeat protein